MNPDLSPQVLPIRRNRAKILKMALVAATVMGIVALVGSAGWGQTWPRCITGCTAKDVTLEDVYLVHLGSCGANGDPIQAELWFTVNFNRNKSYCVRFVCDVYVAGVLVAQDLVSEPYVVLSKGVYDFYVGTIDWICGDVLELRNIQIFWSVDNTLTDPSLCVGCSDYVPGSKCVGYASVEHLDPLVADFYADGPNGCAPLAVQFYSLSWGGYSVDPYAYDWDFGDGTAHSSAEDPVHTYWTPGTYTVTLTVTDTLGDTDTKTRTLYIEVYDCRLEIDKTGDAGPVTIGDNIGYAIRVTNSGNVTLHDVQLVDGRLGIGQTLGDLDPSEFVDVAVVYGPVGPADLPGPIVNTASATSTETPDPVEDDHSVPIAYILQVTVDGLENLSITQPLIGLLQPRQSLGDLTVSVLASVNYEAHVYYTVAPAPTPSFSGDPLVFEYPAGTWTTIPTWPSMALLPGLTGTTTQIYPIGVDLPLLGDRAAAESFTFTVHVVVSVALGP